MVLLLGIAAASVVAVLAYWLARASGQRQLAEQRASFAADLAAARRDNEWLTGQIERERQALGSMREAFQSLAADALNNNRGAFLDALESRHKAFNEIVQPIAEALQKVDVKLADAERERLEAYARLTEKVSALGSTADTLSRALRTPAVRGRWGEMQLRRVVEIAGMLRRCDFDEQPALAGDNGRLRPDLVVHLPGGKQVVVDAKTPLEAFLDAQEAADEETRTIKLQAHARQVRDHMDRLGSKAYWEALASAPEFVVMFLPGETLFTAALQNDLGLIEHGLSQRVLLASPITLIALLTTVAHSWRQEALTENFREVAALGRELYDRLATFAGHLNEVRKRLDGAVQSYNQAAGSFEGRVLVTARRLKDLNVTTAEELPPAESIDTVPRVLKQMGLMGLPDGATTEDVEPV
ncbi:MAG TPA: DNA recombination protein RmuC [Vicinamibacterales bacterium]|jgi:DNA recombination protein RmuC|nr:DNA recombination protein RmuC [Vicinamibacterales bacterium]